jgi:hypothetical protein
MSGLTGRERRRGLPANGVRGRFAPAQAKWLPNLRSGVGLNIVLARGTMFPVELTVPGLCHGRLIFFNLDVGSPPSAGLETSKFHQTQLARPLIRANQTPAVAKPSLPCPRFVQRPSLVEDRAFVGIIRPACKGEDMHWVYEGCAETSG